MSAVCDENPQWSFRRSASWLVYLRLVLGAVMLRRFTKFTDAHPLIAIALAMSAIVVFGLLFLPADPPNLGNQNIACVAH